MITWLWEKVTGTPYYTERSVSAEFGATPGSVFVNEVTGMSDVEVLARHDEFMAAYGAGHPRRDVAEVAQAGGRYHELRAWAVFGSDGAVVTG